MIIFRCILGSRPRLEKSRPWHAHRAKFKLFDMHVLTGLKRLNFNPLNQPQNQQAVRKTNNIVYPAKNQISDTASIFLSDYFPLFRGLR